VAVEHADDRAKAGFRDLARPTAPVLVEESPQLAIERPAVAILARLRTALQPFVGTAELKRRFRVSPTKRGG
jgi:hypothetical protein